MAQEFTIKSQDIEDKINQLLPSQGGFAPGVDFSASTMVIPIVDLTETAEGSSLRQDIQITDGISSKDIIKLQSGSSGAVRDAMLPIDLTVFLDAGDSLVMNSSSTATRAAGSVRQVADINGNLVNP